MGGVPAKNDAESRFDSAPTSPRNYATEQLRNQFTATV